MSPFLEVFRALNEARVRYLVIGGVATALHGVPRMTGDIDLALSLDAENLRRVIEALTNLGFKPRAPVDAMDFIDEQNREKWMREKSLIAFSLAREQPVPLEVDLMSKNDFDFETAYQDRAVHTVEGIKIDVLSKPRLIEMKRATGRPIDLLDAEALENKS